jgi:hypothetical protein
MLVYIAAHDEWLGARHHYTVIHCVAHVLQRHRVLNLMTHVDPWRRPDLDHPEPTAAAGP